jgi:tetratricopeptide (TPR) repeat protein
VLLYKLLTGHQPYRFRTLLPSEIEKVICEKEPERPSTAVSRVEETADEDGVTTGSLTLESVSEARGEQPAGLMRKLKGDLDNIVLMAMRKEPERRYSSVEQLSEDVRRHLEGLPVLASKDTFKYRAGKFVRRHRAGVAASLLVALTIVAGVVATAWQARRAERQRVRAERRFNEVRRLSHSLMFEIHDSVRDLQGSTPTRQLIVSRALEYLDSLAQESGDDPSLQRELATAYEKIGDIQGNPYSANLGDTDGALASYRKAVGIREALGEARATTETRMELGRSYRGLGDILEQKGDLGECLNYYRRSLAIFEQLAVSDPTDTSVRDELARAYETLGDGLGRSDDDAERIQSYHRALAIRQDLLAQSPDDAKMRRSVALSLLKVGGAVGTNKAEAVEYLRRSAGMLEQLSAADPQNARARREVGFVYYQLGRALTEAGDYAGALESRRKAFAIRREFAAQDPQNKQARFDLAVAHGDLAEGYTNTNAPAEGFAEGQRSLEILEELSASDPTNAVYLRNVGLCYERLAQALARSASDERAPAARRVKQWTEARAWYQKALGLFSDLRNRGTLMPADAGQTEKFAENVSACDNAIEHLTVQKR